MKLIPIMQDPMTSKQYKLAPAVSPSTCDGCAFDHLTEHCLSAGDHCSDKDLIWVEILKLEKE